jgi:hypothetical protein
MSQGKTSAEDRSCPDIEGRWRYALCDDTLSWSYPACLDTGVWAAGIEWRFSLMLHSSPWPRWLRQDLLTARGQED